ncbi:MAG TPA: pepsin-like aspartic protease, partial [Polyangiaceae bacterium]|nr:pepsin-like aspartic protease [Polyangiaceae bacterium]
ISSNYGALGPSSWSGELYDDWVGTNTSPKMAEVRFGAIEQQDQFLVGVCGQAAPQGVLGLGQAALEQPGTNGFFDQVVAAGLAPNLFATLLCPSGGFLWLGGYDTTHTTAAPVYTPLTLMGPGQFGEGFYMVDLVSISVGATTIPIATQSFPGTYFDTGASIWSLPPDAFSALTSAIASDSRFTSLFGAQAASFFSSPGNQVVLAQNRGALDAALPSLTFTFGTNSPVP